MALYSLPETVNYLDIERVSWVADAVGRFSDGVTLCFSRATK